MGVKIVRVIWPVLIYTFLLTASSVIVSEVLGDADGAAMVSTGAALISIPVFLWMKRNDDGRAFFGDTKEKLQSRWLVCIACIAAGAAFSVLYGAGMNSMPVFRQMNNETQEALYRAPLFLQIFGLSLVVPIAEELCYRGLVYSRLRRIFPVSGAVFVTALLFALGHGNMIQFIYALPAAVILNLIMEKSSFLLCPICFHMGANLISVIVVHSGRGPV